MHAAPEVLKAVMTPAVPPAGVRDERALLDRQWQSVWDSAAPLPWSLTDADRDELNAFLESFRRGAADWSDIHAAAPILAKAFSPPHALRGLSDSGWVEVELSAPDDERVLTEMPWEVAAATLGSLPAAGTPLLDYLAGRLAVVRVATSGHALASTLPFRPNAAWCVSNPSGVGSNIDLVPYVNILEQTFAAFPYFETESLTAHLGDKPLWSQVAADIKRRKPTVFVLVAHGTSTDEPSVYFQDPVSKQGGEAISIRDLAGVLSANGCWLTLLICCDLVRNTAYSGALELVKSGVPEVVAMQGKFGQRAAKKFLTGFFGDLLIRYSTPIAAAAGRIAAKQNPHSCLPALFSSAAERIRIHPLAEIAPAYDAARTELAITAVPFAPYVERGSQEDRLLESLRQSGVLIVRSGLGDGATELLKECARRAARPEYRGTSRPILYLDLQRRPFHEERASRFVCRTVASTLKASPVLLANDVQVTDATTPAGLLRLIDESRITLVIDHLADVLSDAEETAFWSAVLEQAPIRCTRGLLCLLPHRVDLEKLAGEHANAIKRLTVPPFDLAETTRYAKEQMPGADAQRLFKDTGGKPLLLDGVRQRWLQSPDAAAVARMGARGRETAAHQLAIVWPVISRHGRQSLFELACLPGAADRQCVVDHIVTADALTELVESGVIREETSLLWIPSWTREALLDRHAKPIAVAARRIGRRFMKRDSAERDAVIATLARTPGGAAILECIQQSLIGNSDVFAAVKLAISADVDGARDAAALSLYEAVIPLMKKYSRSGRLDPGVAQNAIRHARNLGNHDRVAELFAELVVTPDPLERAGVLLEKALWLKDTRQAAALPEITKAIDDALALTDAPHDAPEEWDDLRRDILLNSLQVRLFLARETYATVPARYRALVDELPNPADKAVVLCTFAEREMHQHSPEAIDWPNVARWVLEADSILEHSNDPRAITYCAYQYATYLRRKGGEGAKTAAYALLRKAEDAGRESEELRRWAMARLRRVEMFLAHPSLEGDPEDPNAYGRTLLDEVLKGMPTTPGDALTARAAGRLWALRAEVKIDRDDERHSRDRAATAFASPMLHSEKDNRLFVDQATRLLADSLDDPDKGDFRYAQQFIRRFRDRIESVGITVDIETPGVVLAALRQWRAPETIRTDIT